MTPTGRSQDPDGVDFGGCTEKKLSTYRSKRDFTTTAEPAGNRPVFDAPDSSSGARSSSSFVVQRHRARRLHYDFRLQIDGVLVSWALPKGPTLDPSVKRLAVRTEDHPVEYARFEGVIPTGDYGGGDVIVWDEGAYEISTGEEASSALAQGELHLVLTGEKLIGHFMLIRTSDRGGRHRADSAGSESPTVAAHEEWIMFHKRDGGVVGWDPEQHPLSVKSGRTNDQVAARPASIWSSSEPPERADTRLGIRVRDDGELLALDRLDGSGVWHFAGRDLRLTNLDKVLFPPIDGEEPLTKRDLIRHYASFAPLIVHQLKGRPVNLNRFPDGVTEKGFWNKAVPKQAPEWIERWENPNARPNETSTYFVASEEATVAWLGNYGAVELHPWTSTTDRPGEPSFALFDLDPGEGTTWDELLRLARLHRTALAHLGVIGFPNVSGKTGIQIRVPVRAGLGFDDTRSWVEGVSRAVGEIEPDLVSWQWSVQGRGGRARLDYTQNAGNKTLVAPYNPRPMPGAPVSTPISWEELDDPDLRPDRWNIRTIVDRVDDVGDLSWNMVAMDQDLPRLS